VSRIDDERYFSYNVLAYSKLKEISERFENFDVIAIAGFAISESRVG